MVTRREFFAALTSGIAGMLLGHRIGKGDMPVTDPTLNLGEITSARGTGVRALDNGGAVYNLKHARFLGWTGSVFAFETALREAARQFSEGEISGALVIPPGDYSIDRPKILNGPNANGAGDVAWIGIEGLVIEGYGARIDVFGAFHRADDTGGGVSYHETICPFKFINCKDVVLRGVELDGNVDEMTRDPTVVEGACNGIVYESTEGWVIEDVYVHHFANDGVLLAYSAADASGHYRATKKGYARGLRSKYNARQGLSAVQAYDATFIKCEFSWTGRYAGTYPAHSPAAGVDIEPDYSVASGSTDVNTGLLTFIDCVSDENQGGALLCAYTSISDVTWRGGLLRVGGGGVGITTGMAVDGWNLLIEGALIDMGSKHCLATYYGYADGSVTFRGCELRGTDSVFISDKNTPLLVENCRFIGEHTTPTAANFPYIANVNAVLRNNYFFVPKEAHNGPGTGYQVINLLNVGRSERNTFDTDLDGSTGDHFATNYNTLRDIWRDEYVAANNAFRPIFNSTWDTSHPFTYGGPELYGAKDHDFPSLAAGGVQSTTLTVTGAAVGDEVIPRYTRPLLGTAMWAEVSAADTVTVHHHNPTPGAVDVDFGTIKVRITKLL